MKAAYIFAAMTLVCFSLQTVTAQSSEYITVNDKGSISLGSIKKIQLKRFSNITINIDGDEGSTARYQSHIVANSKALSTYFGDGKLDHSITNGTIQIEFKKIANTEEEESWIKSLFTKSNNRYQIKEADVQLQIPKEVQVSVEATYSDLIIQGLVNFLQLSVNYGKVDVKNHSQDITINGNYGKIKLNRISGTSIINSNYCDINGSNMGGISIKANYAKVNLREVGMKGDVTISGNYSEIDGYNLYGRIYMDGNYNTIDLRNLSREYAIPSISIKNTYGDISLSLPESLNPSFKISTRYGDIDIDHKARGRFSKMSNAQVYELNSGSTPKIDINNTYGDVKIIK